MSTKVRLPPLRKGDLIQFGYHTKYPQEQRRQALDEAVKVYSPLSVFHKLNALAVLNKRRPRLHDIFIADRDYVYHGHRRGGCQFCKGGCSYCDGQNCKGGCAFCCKKKGGDLYQSLANPYRKLFCHGRARPLYPGEIHPQCQNFSGQ